VQLTLLGSGSGGNCAYLETPEARILIDAGFSPRQIRTRLASIGRVPESLTAIIITHEHIDHVCGLFGLADKFKIPVYCNRATQVEVISDFKARWTSKRKPVLNGMESAGDAPATLDWRLFHTGASFDLGDVVVETFSIPHDAADPVGFLLRTPQGNIGFLTDLGHATQLALDRVRPAHVLVLESNHDVKMLQDCPRRPWSLKQRILGRHGHLSNEAAAEAAEQVMSADLRRVYLAHLSRECNKPDLAHRVMSERLQKIGAHHVSVENTSQDKPCPTVTL